jgi:hypothetical protein
MSLLTPIVEIFRYGLQPVAPLSWFGIYVSTLDVAGAVRLCMILRQIRVMISKGYEAHAAQSKASGEKSNAGGGPTIESKSLIRQIFATLLVTHGGDIYGKL